MKAESSSTEDAEVTHDDQTKGQVSHSAYGSGPVIATSGSDPLISSQLTNSSEPPSIARRQFAPEQPDSSVHSPEYHDSGEGLQQIDSPLLSSASLSAPASSFLSSFPITFAGSSPHRGFVASQYAPEPAAKHPISSFEDDKYDRDGRLDASSRADPLCFDIFFSSDLFDSSASSAFLSQADDRLSCFGSFVSSFSNFFPSNKEETEDVFGPAPAKKKQRT